MQPTTKTNIFLWALYDFANSIVLVTFFLYLSQWLIINAGISSLEFNGIFIGSTVLLLLTAPVVAALSDKIKRRKIFLIITTTCLLLSSGATALMADAGTKYVWIVVGFYLLDQYFYQFSYIFYNAMLQDLAPPAKRGSISGFGNMASWLGQIAGVLIALLFVGMGATAAARETAPLLPSVLICCCIVAPVLFFLKEQPTVKHRVSKTDLIVETKKFIHRFYDFMRYSPAAIFLLAFFFFNDALVTLSNNFPVYVQEVYKANDTIKSLILLGILVTSALGAYIAGWLGDRIGLKKTLHYILISWIIVLPILALMPSLIIFTIFAAVIGLLYGSVWTVTRAYLANVLAAHEINYGFTFYTLMERFATFVGPLSWGLIVTYVGSSSAFSYRLAALSMTVFVIIGYLIARRMVT